MKFSREVGPGPVKKWLIFWTGQPQGGVASGGSYHNRDLTSSWYLRIERKKLTHNFSSMQPHLLSNQCAVLFQSIKVNGAVMEIYWETITTSIVNMLSHEFDLLSCKWKKNVITCHLTNIPSLRNIKKPMTCQFRLWKNINQRAMDTVINLKNEIHRCSCIIHIQSRWRGSFSHAGLMSDDQWNVYLWCVCEFGMHGDNENDWKCSISRSTWGKKT